MKKSFVLAALAGAAVCSMAFAQPDGSVIINEAMVNPPSPDADGTREFFELKRVSDNGTLQNLWLVVIDGDNNTAGNSTATGVVDFALNLSNFSFGTNGLLLLRDSTLVLQPAPAPETNVVVITPDWQGCTGSVTVGNIDIENGGATYLLVRNFTGSICQDLDTNNDGILDATPWTSVVDALGFIDGDDFDAGIPARQYATQLGGIDFTDNSAIATGFTPDAFARICGDLLSHDMLGTSPGPYVADPAETRFFPDAGQALDGNYTLTPGSPNIEVCGPAGCDDIDFNNNGVFPEDQDVIDFFDVLAGGTPATCDAIAGCNDIDFNNNGVFPEDQDVVDFFNVLAGGTCPQ
ncbi:hypothetical protein LBMAG48_06950 [Phycisphaerae bacterium]|nr:hypothetical protein LBMAG48_06950 [Phycisphaerae bacterium]